MKLCFNTHSLFGNPLKRIEGRSLFTRSRAMTHPSVQCVTISLSTESSRGDLRPSRQTRPTPPPPAPVSIEDHPLSGFGTVGHGWARGEGRGMERRPMGLELHSVHSSLKSHPPRVEASAVMPSQPQPILAPFPRFLLARV